MVVSTFIPTMERKTKLRRQEICFEHSREGVILLMHTAPHLSH